MTTRVWIVGAAILYLVVTLGIGWWAARRTRSAKDFWIAGQGLGIAVTALATMSAAFSGFAFLGGPGLTYHLGMTALMICFPVGFTAALLCWSVGKRLRLLGEVRAIYTIPDAVAARWACRKTAGLSAVAVLVGTVGYLGGQMLALGVAIESVFGWRELLGAWSLPAAMAVGLAVVLFYCTAGGMLASVYTDVLQGGLMLVCGIAVFWLALDTTGGWTAMLGSLGDSAAFGSRFLDPLGTSPAFLAFGFFFVFGVGNLGQPHLLHKFFMLKDPAKLKWFPVLLSGGQILCVLLWLGIGLAVPALVAQGQIPPLAHPDDATPTFLLQFAPPALAGLVFASILAAIMSTADSFVSIAAAACVRDLPRAFGRKVESELGAGRWATVVILLAASGIAYGYGDLIALLGTFSFGTLGAALAPTFAIGLAWRRVPASAVAASIATGLVLNLGLELWSRQSMPGLPPLPLPPGVLVTAFSLAASFAVLVAVTLLDRRPRPVLPPSVAAALELAES